MNPAVLSLAALIFALALSMSSRINVGWLALAFAWLIGVYQAGLRPDAVMAGFPTTLFLTLAGVTLLSRSLREMGRSINSRAAPSSWPAAAAV